MNINNNGYPDLHLFYALSKALIKGSPLRPALPPEIAIYVLRLSECNLVSPLSVIQMKSISVWSEGDLARSKWFDTLPLTRFNLSRLSKLKLVTLSRNQGWCGDPSQGCWSWFDIAIYRPIRMDSPAGSQDQEGGPGGGCAPKLNSNGEALRWTSHRNEQYIHEDVEYEGMDFDSSHEIWSNIADGDRITVEACAQYPGWSCEGVDAKLLIQENFVPSSEFIRLMER